MFRRVENERNVVGMLSAFDKKLGLGVQDAVFNEALPHLELRHLLVHSDGVADESFCGRFPAFGATAGQQVPMTYPVIASAREKLVALVTHYDERAVAKSVIAASELQG